LLFARYELIGFRLNTLGLISAKTGVNPSRDIYKTKADVVDLTQQAVVEGANLIQHSEPEAAHGSRQGNSATSTRNSNPI
jgi:hypothetical protein